MSNPADEIIRDAMEKGKFDDLPGKGKRLNLDDYFNTPEELRVGYSILKNADYVPEEVSLLKEIEELQNKLSGIGDKDERKKVLKELEDRRLKYNLLMDLRKRHTRV